MYGIEGSEHGVEIRVGERRAEHGVVVTESESILPGRRTFLPAPGWEHAFDAQPREPLRAPVPTPLAKQADLDAANARIAALENAISFYHDRLVELADRVKALEPKPAQSDRERQDAAVGRIAGGR